MATQMLSRPELHVWGYRVGEASVRVRRGKEKRKQKRREREVKEME